MISAAKLKHVEATIAEIERHIAEQNGGGGHRFAAGFTSDEPADVVIDKVLAVL